MLIEQVGKREETKRNLDIFLPISKFLKNLEAIISKFGYWERGGTLIKETLLPVVSSYFLLIRSQSL